MSRFMSASVISSSEPDSSSESSAAGGGGRGADAFLEALGEGLDEGLEEGEGLLLLAEAFEERGPLAIVVKR